MPFIAPTFAQSFGPGTVAGDANTAAGGPQDAAAQGAANDKALLTSIQRPDWIVVSKSTPGADGITTWQIAGPNGQTDSMDVRADGTVEALPKKTPEKPTVSDTPPSPPDKWVPIVGPDGTPIAMQDPAHPTSRVDLPKPPAPRTDTPAETQSASTGAAAQAETGRHNTVTEAETARKNQADTDLATARLNLEKSNANFDHVHQQAQDDLANQRIGIEDYTARETAAHNERMDAQAAVNSAEQHVRDLNDASFQQGQIENSQTQNAESTRHNQATEAETADANQTNQQLNAATLLQKQEEEQRTAADAAATRGESLLKDRATMATGINNTLFGAAANSKNYGLGSSADVSGLPQAAQGWATQMMGGQSLFDQAVKQVHDANPALSGTPQGAAYASLIEQIMGKRAQLGSGGLTTPSTPANPDTSGTQTTAALAPPGQAGTVSPSDPRYLGAVIGHAAAGALSNLQGDAGGGSMNGATYGGQPISRTFTAPTIGAG